MDIVVAWLKEWGALSIAAAALAQPWVLAAYRRLFRRPTVEAFPIGHIEVGYSQLGATIGLQGTLLAARRDVFVYAMELDLVRGKDSATHHFIWSLFRGFKAKASELHDVEMELAGGFVLKPGQPRRYNILFQDAELSADVRETLEGLQNDWLAYTDEFEGRTDEAGEPVSEERMYEAFSGESAHVDAWARLDRLRYWEPGSYSLTMRVLTSDPDGAYEFQWHFDLTDAQESLVKLNAVEMVRGACFQGSDHYRFAYSDYDSPKRLSPAQ